MDIKLKFRKPKFNKFLRLIYAGTVIVFLFAFVELSIMLYKNFFSAINQSESIFYMRGMVVTQKVNISSFEKVIENLEIKKNSCREKSSKNPFAP
jgi:hypothetical protein